MNESYQLEMLVTDPVTPVHFQNAKCQQFRQIFFWNHKNKEKAVQAGSIDLKNRVMELFHFQYS